MKPVQLIILSAFIVLFIGCSPSAEVTKITSKSKSANKSFAELPEKEQIKFNFLFHNAIKERLLENYQLAANLFMECAQIAPQEATPYYELANLYDGSGQNDMALKYAERAIELDKDNYWYRVLYAHTLQRSGNTDEAIKQYEMLIEKNGSNIDLYYDLAAMQMYAGKYTEALESFSSIEDLIGITEEISVQKEKLYIKLGNVEKAANEIQKLIDAFPDDLRYKGLLADVYTANNMNDKAFEIYQEILKEDPKNPYAHLSLYEYYKNTNDNEKAFESLKKAFSSEDLDIDTKMKILLTYYSATENEDSLKDEAMELNKILIKTHPEEAKAYTIYADFLYRDKKLEAARDNYKKATELDDSRFAIWSQLMLIESDLQDNKSLLRDSKAALDLFPNQPIFYFFYGATNLQMKNFQEAIEYLNNGKDYVVENKPLLAQFYASLGDAYNGIKDYEKSDAAYEEALKIDGKDIYVLNNYSYYLSLRGDKLERAEKLSALCNELEPDQFNYQDTYAWILYKQGKFVQAKEWLEKALRLGGEKNAVILEHLGDVYSQLNDIDKAVQFWTKAKEIGNGETSEFLDKKIADKKLYE